MARGAQYQRGTVPEGHSTKGAQGQRGTVPEGTGQEWARGTLYQRGTGPEGHCTRSTGGKHGSSYFAYIVDFVVSINELLSVVESAGVSSAVAAVI